MNKILKLLILSFLIVAISPNSKAQTNDECFEMEPFCPNPGLTFTASATGISAMTVQPGNSYDCLLSTPNSTWYYCVIDQSGNIIMNLQAWQDIDFIIYGPFADTIDAVAGCGNMGNGTLGGDIIDCSYSPTNSEFPEIPNGISGEVYVFLITNYANVVQPLSLTQIGGTGSANCSLLPVCLSYPGTYSLKKNGVATSSPINLAPGNTFEIISNGDYSLPLDTIPAPSGDGIYSAQLMWLLYDQLPTNNNPGLDPGFLNQIIPGTMFTDDNTIASDIISSYGCGTYFFVPVAGDDGIGGNNNYANGVNDNGGYHWDKNGNGCYLLGTPVQVNYLCAMQTTVTTSCNSTLQQNNKNVAITGGLPPYSIINNGEGNIQASTVALGGSAIIKDLQNGDTWDIDIVDKTGTVLSKTGTFLAPQISSLDITPGIDCPSVSNGTVDVAVNGASGNGAPYTIKMANDPLTAGTFDSYSNVAGTLVNVVVADNLGCTTDSIVTISSSGHFINVSNTSLNELCYLDGSGFATLTSLPTPSGSVVSITWTGPSGQHPGGNPGSAVNDTQGNLEAGNWIITTIDDVGCEVSVNVTIDSPQQLFLYPTIDNLPSCYGSEDGSFSLVSAGGILPYAISYNGNNLFPGNFSLGAGDYIVYVTDQNNCMDSAIITLTQPDSIYFTLLGGDNITGTSNGSVYSLAAGGIPNYSYEWINLNNSNTHNSSSWNDISAGNYQIVVTDATGCQLIDTVAIGNVGLEDYFSNFSIYPNPIRDGFLIVTIPESNLNSTIYIYDLQGNIILSQNLINGNNIISLDCSNGIYTYAISVNDGSNTFAQKTGKIVVIGN